MAKTGTPRPVLRMCFSCGSLWAVEADCCPLCDSVRVQAVYRATDAPERQHRTTECRLTRLTA